MICILFILKVTNLTQMRLNFDKHFKIKMSDRNFTQRFDVVMTSLSSDKKITVPSARNYLFKQICCEQSHLSPYI